MDNKMPYTENLLRRSSRPILQRIICLILFTIVLNCFAFPADGQEKQLKPIPTFVDLLTKAAGDYRCTFIIRPCELPVPAEGSGEHAQAADPKSDVPAGIQDLLSKFDCYAVRYGTVYAVQEKYSNCAIAPLISNEEYAVRLMRIKQILISACPSGTIFPDVYVKPFLASLSADQQKAILGSGIAVPNLTSDQKNDMSSLAKLRFLQESKDAVSAAAEVLSNYNSIQLAAYHLSVYTYFGYQISGVTGKQLLFNLGNEETQIGSGSSFNPYKVTHEPGLSDVDRSVLDSTRRFASKDIQSLPAFVQGNGGPVVIGNQGDSADCARAIGYLYSLSQSGAGNSSDFRLPDVKDVDITQVGDAVFSELPLPLAKYIVQPEEQSTAFFKKSMREYDMDAGDQALDYPGQYQVNVLRNKSVHDLSDYWAAREKSGAVGPVLVNTLPADAQRDFVTVIVCKALDQVISLRKTPKFISQPDNVVITEKKFVGQFAPVNTSICFSVTSDKQNDELQFIVNLVGQ
jgi:hypothetical protein